MKVWTKIKFGEENKDINQIATSLASYIYKDNPINDVYHKCNVNLEEREKIEVYTINRIAGLLILYFSKDTKRINDIVNKYNYNSTKKITPELEGYVEK